MNGIQLRTATALLVSFAFLALGLPVVAAPEEGDATGEARFLSRSRQLTFEGRRAGEGYFFPDGKQLVFQSEREPGNPFYQIYEMDLETGDTERVSPGSGKTTCAFPRAGSGEILFASTHHDPRTLEYQNEELEFRASGKQRRYAWDYDPEMDIYVAAAETRALTRLTRSRGYDAEGSYSPDGQWIVFSSNRHAYEGELGEEERERLETEPSYFLDIYVMRADGSESRRLTTVPGYDGGPFFSVDGRRIVWRRFDETGVIADIWTMNVDGSDPLRLTEFDSMSWAPYPHPSGEYVLFTSNKHGFDNFELFIVDTAGTRQPVRVTFTPGFDGLPVPTPDGRGLAWTTNRNGKSAQIWLAQWNHEQALAALKEAPLRVAVPSGGGDAVETLAEQLAAMGAEPMPGADGYVVAAGSGDARHVLGYLVPRQEPGAAAEAPGALVLGACLPQDAGQGWSPRVSVALDVAASVAERPLRLPVLVAFWSGASAACGGEDGGDGLAGLPLDRAVAYLGLGSMDAAGSNQLELIGAAGSPDWPGLIERSNVPVGFDVRLQPTHVTGSMSDLIQNKDVPSLDIRLGGDADATASGDDLSRAARFAALLLGKLADLGRPPVHVDLSVPGAGSEPPRPARPFTGTVPEYTAEVDGLRLKGVIAGGPAERAGLRPGDVIVEFAGKSIGGAEDYAKALEQVVIGEPVEVVFLRDGEIRRLEIIPEGRD